MRTRRLGNDPQLLKVESKAILLSRGSTGSGVAQIQDLLASLGFKMPISMKKSGADGIFGAETEAAIKEFQKQSGLKADGLVGPNTLAKLEDRIIGNPALEAPDPVREAAVNDFDASAPARQKRTSYT